MKNIQILTSRQKVPVLTYSADEDVAIGDIVLVPFRNQNIMGVVWNENLEKQTKEFSVKPIIHKFDLPPLSAGFIKFLESFAKYYIIDLASCCKMVLPVLLKEETKRHSERACNGARGIQQTAYGEAIQNWTFKMPSSNNSSSYKLYAGLHGSAIALPLSDVGLCPPRDDVSLPSLNSQQQKAYEEISASKKVSLLEGVTGSGKTEVYFHAIADCISAGKQVLLMLPEIGLTSQLLERFEKTFGFKPALWHSGITPAKKRKIFEGVARGEEPVLIGTRSSLFLPYKNLGLIIVDEEHDGAYKQEENILYNARDAAIFRGSFENIKIILVSATPSIETYLNVKNEKYQHSVLSIRYGSAKMPAVNIVDMKKEAKDRWISKPLELAIRSGLENGLQTLLFLNRRGYAPLMLCNSCGFRFACESCSSWLVVHKKTNSLICHHCGFERKIPKTCPDCSNESIISCGPGVERIAEEASNLFPQARVHLFTKEEANSKDEIISEITESNIDIVIGTQIITKGYHFPKVTTVGIIDADFGVANIDLKANERCFQILQQVSGRAGRDEYEGSVYIQTYFPDNKIFEILSQNQAAEFYQNELENRQQNFLPPYSRIIAVIITGDDEIQTLNFAKRAKNHAPKTDRVKILGPAPATMSKIKGNYRFRILLIADKSFNIQAYANEWIRLCNFRTKENIRVEVDPYSFY